MVTELGAGSDAERQLVVSDVILEVAGQPVSGKSPDEVKQTMWQVRHDDCSAMLVECGRSCHVMMIALSYVLEVGSICRNYSHVLCEIS